MNYLTRLNTQTKIKLGLILILAVFLFSLLSAIKATPASMFFPLKRVQEKIFMKFKSTPKMQVEYLSSLLDNRLEELSNMVSSNEHRYILASSLRYSSTAGNITQLIQYNNLNDQTKVTVDLFLSHQKVLQQILTSYPQDMDTERKYIEDDINYLSIYIQQLSKTATASN